MQFPVLNIVDVLYQQHLSLANGVLDAAISLFGIYFSFVLMPAMDVVLGADLRPKSKVASLCQIAHLYDSYSQQTADLHASRRTEAPALVVVLGCGMSATDDQLVCCLQPELSEAAHDKVYQRLLWSWVGAHCALLAACADAVHSHNLHPLACLGETSLHC